MHINTCASHVNRSIPRHSSEARNSLRCQSAMALAIAECLAMRRANVGPRGSASRGSAQPAAALVASASPFSQQPLRLLAELGPEVCPRQRVSEVGGEKSDLGASVEALTLKLQTVERMRI